MLKSLLFRTLCLAGTLLPFCGCGSIVAQVSVMNESIRPSPYPGVILSSWFVANNVTDSPPLGGGGLPCIIIGVVDLSLSAVLDTVLLPYDIYAWIDSVRCPDDATWLSDDELNPQSVSLDGDLLTFRFAIARGPWFPNKYFLKFECDAGTLRVGVMEGYETSLVMKDLPNGTKEVYLREYNALYQILNPYSSVGVGIGEKHWLGAAKEGEQERVAKVELVFELSEDFRGNFTFGETRVLIARQSTPSLRLVPVEP